MSCDNLEQLLKNLYEGNQTFVHDPRYKKERQENLEQDPCVIVVSCSDARVSIPVIFSFPYVGTFFEVKTAGQILDSSDLESIKYAVTSYQALAIIMLGHTGCGAVESTVKSIIDPDKRYLRTEFPTITTTIAPAVYKVLQSDIPKTQVLHQSIIQNTLDRAEQLKFTFGDQLPIIPAVYNISTGKVTLLNGNKNL